MQISPELKERWKFYESVKKPGLMEAFAIRITDIGAGLVKARMPVTESVKQPFGLLHGGASVALAESLASLGSWMLIDPETQRAAGLEINANHLRPVSEGTVYAEAAIVHEGRRTHVWQITITDEKSRPVCISRCTVSIIS